MPVVASPDAALLRLCAEFDALERQYQALFVGANAEGDDAEERRKPAEDAIAALQGPLLDRICALRATTPEGWRARAGTLALYAPHIARHDPGDHVDSRMVGALLRDLLDGRA